jgi:putative SOS response-associated peptidase YedK
MCGGYTVKTQRSRLAGLFGFPDETPELPFRYNVRPTQAVPVVRPAAAGGRELVTLEWGLIPSWSRDGKGYINARGDTVAEKPAFRSAFRKRRCLLVADGFYEWQKAVGRKQPWHFRLKDGGPFAFAGLWEPWKNGEGKAVETCALITTEPNDVVKPVHDRMPVILDSAAYVAWLDPSAEIDVLKELLRPCAADGMEGFPVGLYVNSSRNEGPRCIEPAA